MLKSHIIILVFGVFSILIILFGLINFTSKFIFGYENVTTKIKETNYIYDQDRDSNFSLICLFYKQPYKIPYENTTCHNKTLIHWYVPWMRYNVWKNFWKEIKMKKERHVNVTVEINKNNETKLDSVEEITITSTPIPDVEIEKSKNDKQKEKSSVVISILVGLLIVSALAAFWEVFKDKIKDDQNGENKTQDKECSLADFTLSRHIRRESQIHSSSHLQRQASFDIPAKVTKTLLHQSSLDRDYPKMISEVKLGEMRRNSVPSYLINDSNTGRNNLNPSSQSPFRTFRRQQSIDMSSENLNSDVRKKPRHFIRRH